MGKYSFFIVVFAVVVCSVVRAEKVAEKELNVKIELSMDVGIFDRPAYGAKKLRSIPIDKFPAKVWYLKTSDNGMHNIRLTPGGEAVWVKGVRVKFPGFTPDIEVTCEMSPEAKPGYGGRALGNKTKCKKDN